VGGRLRGRILGLRGCELRRRGMGGLQMKEGRGERMYCGWEIYDFA
jgi:hypothetical protein